LPILAASSSSVFEFSMEFSGAAGEWPDVFDSADAPAIPSGGRDRACPMRPIGVRHRKSTLENGA
jgi:hypothetical protein